MGGATFVYSGVKKSRILKLPVVKKIRRYFFPFFYPLRMGKTNHTSYDELNLSNKIVTDSSFS